MNELERCNREELALLAREYLMAGHLIDRAGMPQVMSALGDDAFSGVAIEEWMGASPVYTKRMQRALGYEGDSVATIFKGIQLDVGAPPQFLDFRFKVDDHDHGEFWLDHCGALADVEPMGEDYVHTMCHAIEDPTFDATAIAVNSYAQVRPVHRPPRVPADRHPVCHWTVVIDETHDPLPIPAEAEHIGQTRAAGMELSPIDPADEGQADYSGPLVADIRLDDYSRSALVRIAEEVCLQGHLLSLSFLAALERRTDRANAEAITRKQLVGVAGVAAERLHLALGLDRSLDAAARVLALHPAFQPQAYVGAEVTTDDRILLRLPADGAGIDDGGWPTLIDAEHTEVLDAIVRAVDPCFRVVAVAGPDGHAADGTTYEVVVDDGPAPVAEEVVLTKFSTGAEFAFVDRGTPVEVRAGR